MFLYISLYSFHFGEVRRTQLAKTVSSPPRWCPCDLFRSFKVCSDAKESGVQKAMGSYRTYSVPGKTALLVFEFTVEDLPSTELEPRFRRLQLRTCPWAEHSNDDILLYYNI